MPAVVRYSGKAVAGHSRSRLLFFRFANGLQQAFEKKKLLPLAFASKIQIP
jgi:hypothetical protein